VPTAPIRRNGLARTMGFAVRVRSPVNSGDRQGPPSSAVEEFFAGSRVTGSGPRDRGGHPGDHQIGDVGREEEADGWMED